MVGGALRVIVDVADQSDHRPPSIVWTAQSQAALVRVPTGTVSCCALDATVCTEALSAPAAVRYCQVPDELSLTRTRYDSCGRSADELCTHCRVVGTVLSTSPDGPTMDGAAGAE